MKANSPRLPGPASTPGHEVTSAVIRSLAVCGAFHRNLLIGWGVANLEPISSSELEVKSSSCFAWLVPFLMTIGEVSRRSGVASSALRYYEERGLIASERAGSGHRRFPRSVLRRIAFIVFAQRIGLTLEEIGAELTKLPPGRVPDRDDWAHLIEQLDCEGGRTDRRARAAARRPDGVHRLRLPLSRPLPAVEPRRPSGGTGSGPPLLDRRSPSGLTSWEKDERFTLTGSASACTTR